MKLRPQYDRRAFSESRRILKPRESTVMPTELNSHDGSGLSLALQPGHLTRTPAAAVSISQELDELQVAGGSTTGESSGRPASRRPRGGAHGYRHPHSHSHSHSHGPGTAHTQLDPEAERSSAEQDSGESSASFSELRYLFHWLQKSLPFIIILSAKLIIQHALGLAVGVGLFTTFLYVNKNIQTQVFLQDRRSKLQCLWLLSFLVASSLLFYYTFQTESLYYCLILINPHVEHLDFWEVLWAVGVTSFIVKFVFMGFKCLILLLPSPVMVYRRRAQWYMFIEEISQIYQVIAPMPPWFRYLVSSLEVDGSVGLTLGVLLALLYLILKLLGLYSHWGSLKKTVRAFLSYDVNGAPATQSQCTEAGDICPICQSDFKQPRVLLCQHIFCEECIALWFNQEKTCPLCRTIITDKVYKWKDGATSPYLQIY
ncbi:E3 ubiquitin-protein ligase RNFT1 [Pygocentrus nattereri]|uniref:E3 ubiquitin-protein ligase RNFT1 n=1 Tax=Pygocentrus nattereri TaxID=42514 RepID=A0A3B4DSD7_PYGNA|nr:E3 ubiquitin-protein ligase RNFT1 [Pygocentrus nattereri]XP_017572953.1 E3 ubiquitin-protein ligase RNFT1 [Pygocentrus nattereri]XP_037402899.1 E3 ubiquitin-protein ligase RNFT1 [Pygocentrus nattereri]